MREKITIAAIAVVALALAACNEVQTPAQPAADEAAPASTALAFEGTWAADAAGCAIPQEQQGAPHIFGPDNYDQHEVHCTYANVAQEGPHTWNVAAVCMIEGENEASVGWRLDVEGDTMQMVPGPRLIRCP